MTEQPTPRTHRPQWADGVPTGWCECGKPTHLTEQPTPRTEAGRRLIGYLTPDALALVAKAEAEAAAQARTEALDVEALAWAMASVQYGSDPIDDDRRRAGLVATEYRAILAAKETPDAAGDERP